MRIMKCLWIGVKDLVVLTIAIARGGRHCYRCGKFAKKPHQAWGYSFCDRLCAASWKRAVEISHEVTVEQRARSGGMGA